MNNIKIENIKLRGETRVSRMTVILAASIFGGLGIFGCSSGAANTQAAANRSNTNGPAVISAVTSPTPTPNTTTGKVPASLSDAGEYGENTYDMAKINNWGKAAEKVNKLKQSQSQMADANIKSPELDIAITSLEKDVAAKDRPAALHDSNQVTFVIADLTAKYNPQIPVEVTKLDYYGRELEIWSMAKDEAKLKSTAAAMRSIWNAVKPMVEAKGGGKQAQTFEALVVKADTARTIEDYAKVATPILDEVDNLEKVFEK